MELARTFELPTHDDLKKEVSTVLHTDPRIVLESFSTLNPETPQAQQMEETRLKLLALTANPEENDNFNLEQAMLNPEEFTKAIMPGLAQIYEDRSIMRELHFSEGDKLEQKFITLADKNPVSTVAELEFNIVRNPEIQKENSIESATVESLRIVEGAMLRLIMDSDQGWSVELKVYRRGDFEERKLSPEQELMYAQAIFTDMLAALTDKKPEDDRRARDHFFRKQRY